MTGPLFALLEKRAGSKGRALSAIDEVAWHIGRPGGGTPDEKLAGLALCARGERPETVSKALSWKDFEGFCSEILRSRGFLVRENVMLRKPRAQVDVFAASRSLSLAVDCKHWARAPSHSSLTRLVEAQKSRARRLHETLDDPGPIASMILVMVDGGARFVSGGAVVPIFALADFLDNVESFRGSLSLV